MLAALPGRGSGRVIANEAVDSRAVGNEDFAAGIAGMLGKAGSLSRDGPVQGTLCPEPRAEAFLQDLLNQLEARSGSRRSR